MKELDEQLRKLDLALVIRQLHECKKWWIALGEHPANRGISDIRIQIRAHDTYIAQMEAHRMRLSI